MGPPVEELAAARQELNTRLDENTAAQQMLNKSFSDSVVNMQGDDVGVAMIKEHQDSFSQSISEVANQQNMAYAGNVINDRINQFVGDYRIKGRQGLVDEVNGYKDAIKTNKNKCYR